VLMAPALPAAGGSNVELALAISIYVKRGTPSESIRKKGFGVAQREKRNLGVLSLSH